MRRLVIILVVLVGLLIAVDRIGVVVAERALATQVRDELELAAAPDVDIRGIPFLTQAIGGDYSDVRVSIPDVDSGPLQNILVNARLQGVRVPLGKVVGREVDEVPVDRITGDLTVGYDDLARASGITGLRIVRAGEGLRVSGSVQALGRQVDADAVGRVEIQDNDIVIIAEQAEVDGIPTPQPVLDAAARLLSFRVSPRGLPLSLRITSVRLGDTTLAISAESTDVVLRAGDLPAS